MQQKYYPLYKEESTKTNLTANKTNILDNAHICCKQNVTPPKEPLPIGNTCTVDSIDYEKCDCHIYCDCGIL